MTSTPTQNIRLTISVTPEVHETFQRIAKAGNMSLSKVMGEWLADTMEAADFMAQKMEQARAAPKLVMAEMHAYALGLSEETGALMDQMRQSGQVARAQGREGGAAAPPSGPASDAIPPSGNTGGKGIRKSSFPRLRGGK